MDSHDNSDKKQNNDSEYLEEELIDVEENIVSQEELEKRKEDFEKEAMPHINLLQNYACLPVLK